MPGYIGVDIYQLPVYWTLFYEKIAKTVINLSKKELVVAFCSPFQIYLHLSESTCMWDLHGCTVGFRYETLLPGCWYLWAPCLLNPFLWEEKKEALIILSKGETSSLLLIYLPLSIFTWIQYMSKMHVQLFLQTLLPPHHLPSRNVRLHYFIHQQVCQGYISVQPLLYQLYCIFLTQL